MVAFREEVGPRVQVRGDVPGRLGRQVGQHPRQGLGEFEGRGEGRWDGELGGGNMVSRLWDECLLFGGRRGIGGGG